MMTDGRLQLMRLFPLTSRDAGERDIRTGLVGVIPTGAILCMEKTILLDEWARGRCPSDEINIGGIGKGDGGRRILVVVPEDQRGHPLIRPRIDGGMINEGNSLRIHVTARSTTRASDSHKRCTGREHEVQVLGSRISGLRRFQEVRRELVYTR
jgi:hypothetical protein